MIFDRVISSAVELFGDDFPFVSVNFMRIKDFPFFFKSPLFFVNFGIEMIDPSE